MEVVEIPNSIEVKESELTVSKAKNTLLTVRKLDHVEYLKCYRTSQGWEFIVFKTKVQLPQTGIVNDIGHEEIIAVGFDPADESVPEVFALRKDFPSGLPHTNLRLYKAPVSLCLYDVPYDEVKLTFTTESFIERIRAWLKNTAIGKLHQDSQFLEPFLNEDDGIIILPTESFSKPFLSVAIIGSIKNKPILNAEIADKNNNEYIIIRLAGKPRPHGTHTHKPDDFNELSNFLKAAGIDFTAELLKILKLLKQFSFLNKKLIFWARLEKYNTNPGSDREYDHYTFQCELSAKQIGETIGMWQEFNGSIGDIYGFKEAQITGDSLSKIKIKTLKPMFAFDTGLAKFCNKLSPESIDKKILAIGLGALGSQVFNNLSRQGYGKWILVDDDVLLPHNLARHMLTSDYLGLNKAYSVSVVANKMLNDPSFSRAEVINILKSSDETNFLQLINEVDLIVDFSASVAVARKLAIVSHNKKRIISCFLNPAGHDLVILAEDERQSRGLDYLEMVYYRFVAATDELNNHLRRAGEKKYYAQSCRDVTFRVSQDNFSINVGIASASLKRAISEKESSIQIWTTNDENFTTRHFTIPTSKVHYVKKNDWEIYYDEILLHKLSGLRNQKLPNETGGILIGSYDVSRQKLYIVDTVASPSDSKEYPTGYERGNKGLDQKLDLITERTTGQLRYVGEWHSHPEKCSLTPSSDDKKNFEWIRGILKNEGYPPLSVIIGDNSKIAIFIETMP